MRSQSTTRALVASGCAAALLMGLVLTGSPSMASDEVSHSAAGTAAPEGSGSADGLKTSEHFVPHVSTAPALRGEQVELYVRQVSKEQADPAPPRTSPSEAVLFIHGTTFPSTPNYDLPYKDYSWMGHLAENGYNTFAMDATGYGKSTRPAAMADPCNLSPEQQQLLVPDVIPEQCRPSYPFEPTTLSSEWDDIDAVVDYILELTGRDKVHLVGWSGVGPRFGGYAALHPEKVDRMVLLAPVYDRNGPSAPPDSLPAAGAAFTITTRDTAFRKAWDPSVKCENQLDPGIRDVIWASNMDNDQLGATWVTEATGGEGVVRRPGRTIWGWNAERANQITVPTLVIVGEHDSATRIEETLNLYADLGSSEKAHVTLPCTSHYVPWETAYKDLHSLTLQWLRDEPMPSQPGTKRLAAADRYSTAAAIVQDSFPAGPVPVVFIATGEAFADALAGGPAAAVHGGPLLPVAKAGIPAPILAELDRLDPARIVILGGPNAVSDVIATQLQAYTSGTVTRLAGVNRYDTAARVAAEAFTAPAPQVLIATGLGFADALAGGAVGAVTDSPVLLVEPNSVPPETAAALRALQPRDIAVLGGSSAVSDAVLEQLRGYTSGGVNRLSGEDRYATAARLAQVFWPSMSDVVYLATGRDFPDALAGVPAAGRDGAPLLLVEPHCMPAATRQEIDRLQPSTIVVLGGPATVSDAAANGASCVAAPAP